MQLRETLPFDVKHIFGKLPRDGELRHKFRRFTLNPRVEGRARSVLAFANDVGLDVHEIDLPKGVNGRLVTDPFSDSGYAIEINRDLSVEAKRFAVLHEMGHFFLHSDHEDLLAEDMYFDLSGSAFYVDVHKEREANEFAEALLFGDGQLLAAVGLLGFDMKKLALYFGVTEKVVAVALKKLKIR